MTRRRRPGSRSIRSATPFSDTRLSVVAQRELTVEAILQPAFPHVRSGRRRLEPEDHLDSPDGDRGAEQTARARVPRRHSGSRASNGSAISAQSARAASMRAGVMAPPARASHASKNR